MNIVIVISANTEWQVLKEFFPKIAVQASPYGEWFETETLPYSGVRLSHPLIFFHQGWGKVAAAGATQYVVDRWQPDFVVNLGTCGGFAGNIEKHKIILVEKTLIYDIVEQMGDQEDHIAHYTTDIDLSWLEEPDSKDVVRTLLVSADRDLVVDEIPGLKEQYGAVAGDWESGAIAWVAARNQVPCLILRGVTDLVGGEGGEAYGGNMDIFVEGTRVVMEKLMGMLPNWLERLPTNQQSSY